MKGDILIHRSVHDRFIWIVYLLFDKGTTFFGTIQITILDDARRIVLTSPPLALSFPKYITTYNTKRLSALVRQPLDLQTDLQRVRVSLRVRKRGHS